MSVRNLSYLLHPRSGVVIGASDRAASLEATVWRNLRSGSFTGSVWPLNLAPRPCLLRLLGPNIGASIHALFDPVLLFGQGGMPTMQT